MLIDAGSYLLRIGYQYFAPYHNYDITRRQTMLILAKTFPKHSFQPVAPNRRRYLFTSYRKSQTGSITLLLSHQQRDTTVAVSDVVLEDLAEIDSAG